MTFRYRFERILRTRKLLEDRGVEELHKLKHEKEEHAGELARRVAEWNAARQEATPSVGSTMTVYVILDYLKELSRLQAAIDKERSALDKLEEDIEEQRKRVVELHQQRRIFEKVKERDLKRHNQEEVRRKQKEMDELATVRHGRSVGLTHAD